MKTDREIKDKIIELYQTKEKFRNLISKEKKKSEELAIAFEMAERVYAEKIDSLNWVLDNDNKRD